MLAADLAFAFFLRLSCRFGIFRWRSRFSVRQTAKASRWALRVKSIMVKIYTKFFHYIIIAFLITSCSQNKLDISSRLICPKNKPYISSWTTENNGVLFEAFLCPDNFLIAVFHNQEFFDTITVNQKEFGALEYTWEVYIDVDSNKQTGLLDTEITIEKQLAMAGADYILSRSHMSFGKEKTIPFSQIITNVMNCKDNSIQLYAYAEGYEDKGRKLIVLRGEIPGMNPNSKISFLRYYLTEDNESTYHTGWVSSTLKP